MISVISWIFFVLFLTVDSAVEGKLQKITEDNWADLLTGEWMVEFFAPWCPACRGLQPTWEEFSTWSDDLEVGVAQVDVTESPGLSGRFMVTALPTIFHVKDGVFRQYRGARDKDSLISFVEDRRWETVETLPSWKSPDSLQMSLVSYFFKLSMVLRNVHTTITEEYQLPYWVSYVGFAVATILLGGILGLVLVCCIDCVCPPRRDHDPTRHPAFRQDKKDSDVEEEDVEELEQENSQAEESQDEDISQEHSQEEGSEEEEEASEHSQEESQGEDSQNDEKEDNFQGDGSKPRKRRPRKAD